MQAIFFGGLSERDLTFGIDAKIVRDGYFVLILRAPPSLRCRCYTIGLSSIGQPELAVQGDEAAVARKILHDLANDVMFQQPAPGYVIGK